LWVTWIESRQEKQKGAEVASIEKQISSSRRVIGSLKLPTPDESGASSARQSNTQNFWLGSIIDSSTIGIAKAPIICSVMAQRSVDVKEGLISNAHEQLIQLSR
jgi:hypothetical protein